MNPFHVRQCQGITYTVRPGDTLYQIAGRFNVTVQDLIEANPQITDPSRIVPGQVICIPQAGCPGQIYTVRRGDTLYSIAQRFGVSVQQILAVNPQITNPNVLFIGQRICIPAAPEARECAIVLTLSQDAQAALPAIAGGVVLVQQTDQDQYALTFAATGLPNPENLGDFDTYIGTLTIGNQRYSAVLSRSAPFEQEPTWAGTRVAAVNPFSAPGNTVTISPFNLETGARATPVLGGTISQCRR